MTEMWTLYGNYPGEFLNSMCSLSPCLESQVLQATADVTDQEARVERFIFDSLIQVQRRRLQGLRSIGGLVALSGWCSEARRRVADGFGWPVSPAVHGSEQKCTGLVTFTIFSSYTLITYTIPVMKVWSELKWCFGCFLCFQHVFDWHGWVV